MAVRWFNVSTRQRYYVEGITGWRIDPRTGIAAGGWWKPSTTYCVFDAHDCHREVAVFEPTGGRTSETCRMFADRLCAELNREEATAA